MRRLFTAAFCVVCLFFGVQPGWAYKAVFWEPYDYDAGTAVLYHLDEAMGKKAAAIDLDKPTEAVEPTFDDGLRPGAEGGQGKVANAALMGSAGEYRGDCAFVKEGRFGGSLRLKGGKAVLVGRGNGGTGGCTVECWLRAERLPETQAALVCLPARRPAVLHLLADGSAEFELLGNRHPLGAWRAKPHEWFHASVSFESLTDHLGRFIVTINGAPLVTVDRVHKAEVGDVTRCNPFMIGNDASGSSGFDGWVDEVRQSGFREFYAPDVAWVDTEGKRPAPQGRPWFRDPADLVLRIPFNLSLDPVVAPPGTAFPKVVRSDYDLAPGKLGQQWCAGVERDALVLGENQLAARYETTGLLSPDRGTIAFWVRPMNWDNYKHWNKLAKWPMELVQLFGVLQGEGRPAMNFRLIKTPDHDAPGILDLNPGRWMHIALCWEGKTTTAFVNGEHYGFGNTWQWSRGTWDPAKPVQLILGGGTETRTAMDDLRMYRRALAPSEVQNLIAMFDRRKEMKPLPDVELQVAYNGVAGWVKVQVFPLLAEYRNTVRADVQVLEKGKDKPVSEMTGELDPYAVRSIRLATPPLDFATYQVKVAACDKDDKVLGRSEFEFTRVQPAWWQNTIGISDKPMPGWTPVEIEGSTLRVWGRRIALGPTGLPASVVSRDDDVLSAPIAMDIAAGGKPVELRSAGVQVTKRTEARAEWQARSTGANLAVDVAGWIEFDGMMWFDVTLSPAGKDPVEVDSLVLRIPYRDRNAEMVHWWNGNHGFRNPKVVWIGQLPRGEGVLFQSNDKTRSQRLERLRGTFMPYVMLTGNDRGMAWFAENDRGWTQSEDPAGVVLERKGDSVGLSLNVITTRVRLDGARTFSFGLHPIPVKPLQANWRMTDAWAVIPDSFSGSNLKGDSSTDFQRHPVNMDWDAVAERYKGSIMENRARQGPAAFQRIYGRAPVPLEVSVPGLYQDLRRIDAVPDDTREWNQVWRGTAYDSYDTLHYDREMVDYSVWIWNEWLKHGIVKGVYMDDCWNAEQRVWPGPACYKLPDGYVQPGFQWLGHREYLKRMRQCMVDNGLVPHMCAHTTHTYFICYHSFFDTILDGEDHYTDTEQKRDFMDSWTPDRIRFMNPAKWGLISLWLGWHAGGAQVNKWPTWAWQHERAHTAALTVSDIAWTSLDSVQQLDHAWMKESKIRLDPATEAVPYWALGGLATHQHKDLYVTAWRRKDWCAVILANWSRERIEADVGLDVSKMGFGNTASARVACRDVDPNLLTYFDEDVTRMAKPEVPGESLGPNPTADKEFEDLKVMMDKRPLEERKAKDPDGKFTWKDGRLQCPVRPHDFRLFEFRPAGTDHP